MNEDTNGKMNKETVKEKNYITDESFIDVSKLGFNLDYVTRNFLAASFFTDISRLNMKVFKREKFLDDARMDGI